MSVTVSLSGDMFQSGSPGKRRIANHLVCHVLIDYIFLKFSVPKCYNIQINNQSQVNLSHSKLKLYKLVYFLLL